MVKHWTNVWANKIPSIKNRSWNSLDYLYLSIILSTNGFSLCLEHKSTLYRWCRCSSKCIIINKKQKQQKCIYYLECCVMCRSHKKFQEEWGSTHCQRKMHILQCACQHLQIHRCQIWNLFYNIYCAIGIILFYIQHKFIILLI